MTNDHQLTLYSISEPRPGARWKAFFDVVWPGYRAWYLSEGRAARPDRTTAVEQLRRHMPELMPTYERLANLADDDLAATMLTLWNPPKYLPGCSQAVLSSGRPALIRNYDYSPDLFEQVVYSSRFDQRRVIGTSDCLWGLLDGMNDSGLVVSLAYGGRPGSGPGFGIPLVVRYVLETAANVSEACDVLRRVPVSMAYNLTMVDLGGAIRTAFVAPGRPAEFTSIAVATNHRGWIPEDPDHARQFASVERQQLLMNAVARSTSADDLACSFLQRPVRSTAYDQAFGTLYTAIYRPDEKTVEYRWPQDRWIRTFESPEETKMVVLGGEPDSGSSEGSNRGADRPVGGDTRSGGSAMELSRKAREAIEELASTPDEAAFGELLGLYESLGIAVGEAARTLAENGSWAQVAGLAGVSRQAAWHRWRE